MEKRRQKSIKKFFEPEKEERNVTAQSVTTTKSPAVLIISSDDEDDLKTEEFGPKRSAVDSSKHRLFLLWRKIRSFRYTATFGQE